MKSNLALIPLSILILLSLTILQGNFDPVHAVSKQMESPIFWINKIKNPDRPLLTPSEIEKMNEENLKRQDLLLCRVEDLKEEWSKEEILSFLKEDWGGFGKKDQVRYGKQRTHLDDVFWNELKENINQDALKEANRLLFGFTLKRTDVRVFPTEEASMKTPAGDAFDLFQHSAIAPGVLVGIYHFSRDKTWAYSQTPFIRGWLRAKDIAIAHDRNEASVGGSGKAPLVVTGNFVKAFADPQFKQPLFSAQMGTTFPILGFPDQNQAMNPYYIIRLPKRDNDGRLTFRNGYIPSRADVHYGFLPYTQRNLAKQAFKMLHQPYGWGELSGGRDCSRFIMDLFNSFGILMPRNSYLQAKMGISLGPLEGKTIEEKKRILDRAIPLATLLRMPGHIMLYLGKHDGVHYAIHSIWGIQKKGGAKPVYQKIGKVAVTDLSLGQDGPNGPLLQRLTEIQLIGPDL